MASRPPPAPLAQSALRALPAIQAGVARGLSSRALQSTLASTGMGVRRTDLLRAMAYVRDVEQAADRIRFVGKDRLPSAAVMPEARTTIRSSFSYAVRVAGAGPGFDADGRLFVQVASDRNLTPGEIEDAALEAVEEGDDERYADAQVSGVTLVGAVRAGRFGSTFG